MSLSKISYNPEVIGGLGLRVCFPDSINTKRG